MKVDPYLCRYCLEARFPTAEAREEHYKTCPTRLHMEKMSREQEERHEEWCKKHPEKCLPVKERETPWEAYHRWWHGKLCRTSTSHEFKRVVEVNFYGPPSMVYGTVELVFEDGTRGHVSKSLRFKPRKSDVEVLEE